MVIVGGGIIGLCTAYYLSQARKSGRSITIVDSAARLFAGASGKANGILGDYGFEREAEPLGKLSWELHQQLASVHRGQAVWGYRDVMIYDMRHAAPDDSALLAPVPAWFKSLERHASTLLPDHEHAARMLVFSMFLELFKANSQVATPPNFASSCKDNVRQWELDFF